MASQWLELSVECDPEAAEAVTELFGRYVEGGVAIEEPFGLEDDGQARVAMLGMPVTVRAYIPDDDRAPDVRARIEEGIWYLGRIDVGRVQGVTVRRVAEEDWANAWKEHYQVLHLGARTVIKPSWRTYTPRADEVVVELDPGMAFGTGLHPTTRTCLRLLEEVVRPGDCVLDVGTGSGILGIAALKLGAARVLAVDVSAVAVETARANAAANGLGERMDVRLATLRGAASAPFAPLAADVAVLDDEDGTFDVVVANIIARVIADLAPALIRAIRPGGVLIASGILDERIDIAEAPLREAGLVNIERVPEGDWMSVTGRRTATT
ncbi:MAG TPA: 50S ribosomal protein L11 methyltransferase [Ktedonobacterales bacterium]